MFRRTIVADIVQGIIAGGVLAFITFQILTNAYVITGPGWQGTVPQGMKQVSSPNNSVLVLGRILVYRDSDLPTAYGLAKQIRLTPLSQKR